jgi:hypothetical protein
MSEEIPTDPITIQSRNLTNAGVSVWTEGSAVGRRRFVRSWVCDTLLPAIPTLLRTPFLSKETRAARPKMGLETPDVLARGVMPGVGFVRIVKRSPISSPINRQAQNATPESGSSPTYLGGIVVERRRDGPGS